MARPKKAVVDYFPHYVTSGKTMFTLESKYGNDGYAFWFKVLELMGSTENHFIDCRNPETWEYLLAKTQVSGVIADEILCLLARLNTVDKDLWAERIVWSENFVANMSEVYKRRRINVYTKEDIQGLCIHKHPLNGVSADINPQSKVKESKVKESKAVVNGNRNCEYAKFYINNINISAKAFEIDTLTKYEEEGMEPAVILKAVEEAVLGDARNLKYITRVLNDWHKAGVINLEQLQAYQEQWNQKKAKPPRKQQGQAVPLQQPKVPGEDKFAMLNWGNFGEGGN